MTGQHADPALRRIDVLVPDGVDELTALAPWQVLRTAAVLGAPLAVRLAHLPAVPRPRGWHGLQLRPDGPPAADVDVLVVPGAGLAPRLPADAAAVIHRAVASGAVLASVCTGGLLLAAAGLLTGRPATTHWDLLAALRASGADARDARVVDDGDVVTSGGGTCGLDLGLRLVHRLVGAELAYLTACALEHEPSGIAVTASAR